LITSEDTSKEKYFSGGCQQLIEWFCIVQNALPPHKKQLNADALDKATAVFLNGLMEPPSDKRVTYVGVKLSASTKKPGAW
jgi:hypothetical protein